MLDRLSRWCFRHRWWVLLAWLAVLIGAFVANRTAGGELSDDFEFATVEANEAHQLLAEGFPEAGAPEVRVVVGASAPDGVRDEGVQRRIDATLDAVGRVDGVVDVEDQLTIAPEGNIGFATIRFDPRFAEADGDPPEGPLDQVRGVLHRAAAPGIGWGLSGQGIGGFDVETGPSEMIGLAVALVVLLLTFGTPLAAALPVLLGVFAVGVSLLLLGVVGRWMDIPVMAPAMASMIGLGVGIDYSLFILTRYRQGTTAGLDRAEAAARAVRTSGRAVLFAGATVVVSLLGLLLVDLDLIRGRAIGAAMAVVATMLTSITLLPAALSVVRGGIDRLRIRQGAGQDEARWRRWSRRVQRHPIVAAVAGGAVLLTLASPVLSMFTGFADSGSARPGSLARTGYDLMAEGFGPGTNGPLVVVLEDATPSGADRIEQIASQTDGVDIVLPAEFNDSGDLAMLVVIPDSSPQDAETARLVDRLRDQFPDEAHVGGGPALDADLSRFIAGQTPGFMIAVLVLSFVLLTIVFRSIVLPLKAVVLNLLSIGAAYGVVVAVFQWGWLADVFALERTGPIEPFFPMFLFAILFGLSMDYEVFILTRIHEEYVRTKDNARAVADGLAATAGVITAAAAIMISIFGSFLFAEFRMLKLFGLGLTVAVLVDATLVRLVMVPSTMELMGKANWWLPGWLDRLIPHVHLEDEH